MNMIFGTKLKEVRVENNLTQKQLAEFLHVSTTTICQWETLKQEPSLDALTAIAKLFHISADYLLGLDL